jgi:hypothetical protein
VGLGLGEVVAEWGLGVVVAEWGLGLVVVEWGLGLVVVEWGLGVVVVEWGLGAGGEGGGAGIFSIFEMKKKSSLLPISKRKLCCSPLMSFSSSLNSKREHDLTEISTVKFES